MPSTHVTTHVTINKTTRLFFQWTEEQIKALLEREVKEYMEDNFTTEQVARAKQDMTFGSRYEGGIEAHCRVEVEENG